MLPKLGEVLTRAGVIDERQLEAALSEQERWGHRLGVALIKLGFVEEDQLVRALAHQMRLPMARLEGREIAWDALRRIPGDIAEQTMTLPLHVEEVRGKEVLYLGMEDPTNVAVLDDLRFRAGTEVRPVLVAPSELAEGIDRFYRMCGYVGSEAALPMSGGILAPDDIPVDDLPLPEPLILDDSGLPIVPNDEDTHVLDPTPVIAESGEVVPEEGDEDEAPSPAEAVPSAERVPPPADDSTRRILQAVTQLLVEEGVLDRDALRERVRALEERDAAAARGD